MLEKNTAIKNSMGSLNELSKAATQQVADTARVLDKNWEQVQKKTFTNWINSYLKKINVTPIIDLTADLSNGENLILLLRKAR
jgi:trehalose-6-phosphate synthase